MNNKDAIEMIFKEYRTKNDLVSISVEPVSKTVLNALLHTCDNKKHLMEVVNFYDDEDSPDCNNWVDVEGEGFGWLWLKEEYDERKWHGLLRNHLLDFIRKKDESLNDKADFVIIATLIDQTIYHFVERESLMRDTIYTFSDLELHY